MRTCCVRVVTVVLALLLISLVSWLVLYPFANDPRNVKYVFWKVGLYRMNPDLATEIMVGDADRDRLVVGKTELQLRSRFGDLLAPANASEYLRQCYEHSPWSGKRVLFIRRSPWMVVFDGNKATNLVLIKGC